MMTGGPRLRDAARPRGPLADQEGNPQVLRNPAGAVLHGGGPADV